MKHISTAMHSHRHTDACPEGITRQTVPALCAANGIPHSVRRRSLADANQSYEVFCTGTMGELAGVVLLDGQTIGDGEVGEMTKRLSALYLEETARSGYSILDTAA